MECTWLPFLLVIIDTSFVIYDNQPSSANNIVVALEEFLCHYLYQICCSFVMAKRIWNPGYVHITLPALTKKYGCYASRLMARRVVWELTREACERPAAAKGTLFSLSSGLKTTCCLPYSMHSILGRRCGRHAKSKHISTGKFFPL